MAPVTKLRMVINKTIDHMLCRSKDPMAAISQVPRGHHRQEAKLQETSRLRKTKDGHQDECT